MEVVVETAPTEEPVSLTEAKLFLRVDSGDEDALVGAMIESVRRRCEHEIRRSLLAQTLKLTLVSFPDGIIDLYRPPIQSISSVKYYDDDNVLQTLTAGTEYMSLTTEDRGMVYLPDGCTWPSSVYDRPDAVQITYVAGWTSVASVPESLKSWMYLMLGSLYANREAFAVGTITAALPNRFVDGLLDSYRVYQ